MGSGSRGWTASFDWRATLGLAAALHVVFAVDADASWLSECIRRALNRTNREIPAVGMGSAPVAERFADPIVTVEYQVPARFEATANAAAAQARTRLEPGGAFEAAFEQAGRGLRLLPSQTRRYLNGSPQAIRMRQHAERVYNYLNNAENVAEYLSSTLREAAYLMERRAADPRYIERLSAAQRSAFEAHLRNGTLDPEVAMDVVFGNGRAGRQVHQLPAEGLAPFATLQRALRGGSTQSVTRVNSLVQDLAHRGQAHGMWVHGVQIEMLRSAEAAGRLPAGITDELVGYIANADDFAHAELLWRLCFDSTQQNATRPERIGPLFQQFLNIH